MNAVVDFVVHFDTFKNIDLFRQGLYHIHASLYTEDEELKIPTTATKVPPVPTKTKNFALPYHILTPLTSVSRSDISAPEIAHLKLGKPASLDEENQGFRSKTFRVQYCEQEIPMNDACIFRLEIDGSKRLPVFLQVELVFFEYNSTDFSSGKVAPELDKFSVVSTKTYKFADVFSQGLRCYYPITFDDRHFCLVHTMVHSMVVDFRFRPKIIENVTPQQIQAAIESGQPPPQPVMANSFAVALFPRGHVNGVRRGLYTPEEVCEIADRFHQFYVHTLIFAYNQTAETALKYINEVFPNPLRADLGPRPINAIELPAAMLLPNDPFTSPRSANEVFPFPRIAPLSARVKAADGAISKKKVADAIAVDVSKVAEQNFALWTFFYQLLPRIHRQLIKVLKNQYEKQMHERHAAFVFREVAPSAFDRWKVCDPDMSSVHAHVASVVRRSSHQGAMPPLPMVDCDSNAAADMQVVIFDQTFNITSKDDRPPPSVFDEVKVDSNPASATESPRTTNSQPEQSTSSVPPAVTQDDSQVDSAEENVSLRDILRDDTVAAASTAADSDQPNPPDEPLFDRSLRSRSISTMQLTIAPADKPEARGSQSDLLSGVSAEESAVAAPALPVAAQAPNDGPASPRLRTAASDGAATGPQPAAIQSRSAHTPPHSPRSHSGSRLSSGASARRQNRLELESDPQVIESIRKQLPGKHVFIMVHGYQGNSWDMRLFKNHLAVKFPEHYFMLSHSNEDNTEGDVAEMGERLAKEVDEFIQDIGLKHVGRISFIAHSLGGLIVRAALTSERLEPYLSRFFTFMTLATPHCGYLYSDNVMLDTGIWVLKKWNKSTSLSQLSLTDAVDPNESFLHKLSQKKGLQYFRNVLLLASMQDKYAPFHSARIELHSQLVGDKRRGAVFQSMVHNLLAPLENCVLKRFDLGFVHKKKNLDSFIGRTAHIYFLDQPEYMDMITTVFSRYFA